MTALATIPRGTADATIEHLWPTPHPFLEDPVGWARAKRGAFLWSKQREIAESVRDNRYTAVPSAHDMGKSWVAANVLAWFGDVHNPNRPRQVALVWTAPTYRQVSQIMTQELIEAHTAAELPGRVGLDSQWKIGDRLIGFGRKPADYNQAAFQGTHARYVLVVIDEACGVPKSIFEAVDALVTNEGARVLAIGNPDDPDSHFAKICDPGSREGKGWNVIPVDGLQSPNFTGEYVPEDLRPMLLGRTWVQERVERWGEDSAIYQAKVRGLFSKTASRSMIRYAIVARARRLEYGVDPTPGGPLGGVLGVDVARSESGDRNTIVSAYRGRIEIVDTFHEVDLEKVADRVVEARREGGPNWKSVVDGDGVGGGLVDILRRRRENVVEFRGSKRAVRRPTRYRNRRAEAWAGARDQLNAGLWALPPDDGDEDADDLAADLSAPRRQTDPDGRTGLESKDDIARRLGRSPDLGDACVMAISVRPDVHSPGAIRPERRRRRRSPAAGIMTEPV